MSENFRNQRHRTVTVTGCSTARIALHWGVARLILFQLVCGEGMGPDWRAVRQGGAADLTTMVWAHILVGIVVLGQERVRQKWTPVLPPDTRENKRSDRLQDGLLGDGLLGDGQLGRMVRAG